MDHAANPRHPSPWYGGSAPIAYINAALLFHEPLTLGQGEALALRYRVVVHDGAWDRGRATRAAAAYIDG